MEVGDENVLTVYPALDGGQAHGALGVTPGGWQLHGEGVDQLPLAAQRVQLLAQVR